MLQRCADVCVATQDLEGVLAKFSTASCKVSMHEARTVRWNLGEPVAKLAARVM